MVNCAGHDVGGRTPFHRSDIDDALSVLHTNAAGLLRLTHALLPVLAETDPADVVTIGSVNGVRPAAGLAAYSASKSAVHGFTAALREECADLGIRVTEVLPGMTRTGFAATRWRGDQAKAAAYYDSYPALLDPGDVASAVRFALDQPRESAAPRSPSPRSPAANADAGGGHRGGEPQRIAGHRQTGAEQSGSDLYRRVLP